MGHEVMDLMLKEQGRLLDRVEALEKKLGGMTTDEYQEAAMRTKANPLTIAARFSVDEGKSAQFMAGVVGLADEVGEISSILKKSVEYGKGEVDVVHLKEEVGDCLWRLAQIADTFGFKLSECMRLNIQKLEVRYPDKYSDFLALNRSLGKERIVLEDKIEPAPESLSQNGNGWAEPPEEPERIGF